MVDKMKTHVFLMDPIEKLNIKKDSTLLMAHTFQERGDDVYLLFEDSFSIDNKRDLALKMYRFESSLIENGYYLKDFQLKDDRLIKLNDKNLTIHMRLDPPFDLRYLKNLWVLRFLEEKGINVANSALGILKNHEKLTAFLSKHSMPTLVTSSRDDFLDFCCYHNLTDIILKPMELFQGIGVTKIIIDKDEKAKILEAFDDYQKKFPGVVIVQPYNSGIEKGEVRAVFYQGNEIGSIIKIPKKGEFLANIAQGASFKAYKLQDKVKKECHKIAKALSLDGVGLVAFDIIGNEINEVNMTCPGLLVEVSHAHQKNLTTGLFA